jgi:hypothetical protein
VSWQYKLGDNTLQNSATNPVFKDVNAVYTSGGTNDVIKVVARVTRSGVTKNYEANIRITPRPIAVKPVDRTKVYDGYALVANDMEIVSGTLVSGDVFNVGAVVYNGSQTAVGSSNSSMFGLTISGSDQRDYAITYAQGILNVMPGGTVNPKPNPDPKPNPNPDPDPDPDPDPNPDPDLDTNTPEPGDGEDEPGGAGNVVTGGGNNSGDGDDVAPEDTGKIDVEDDFTPFGWWWTGTGRWSLFDLICTVFAVVVAIICAIMMTTRRKYDDGYQANDVDDSRVGAKRPAFFVLSILIAVVSIILFVLTQDMKLPMTFFDRWSVVFAIAAALGAISARMTFKKRHEERV